MTASLQPTQDLNIRNITPLISPRALKAGQQVSEIANRTVIESREALKLILAGQDDRLLVVVGPCSIHEQKVAVEYARRLRALVEQVQQRMLLVMRVYFEKPRTSIGWKGLINDPHLNGTFDIEHGLLMAREILLEITNMGLPTATEMLEPITPQYIDDLITLGSIGARTTESPTHRQMSSGLSMPVGFKNGTEGNLDAAINAMQAAVTPHSFLGIDQDGNTCILNTKGNPWSHLILRGGRTGPNYDSAALASVAAQLAAAKLPGRLVVDCSHANSSKDYRRQSVAWNDVIGQRMAGNSSIIGLMLESNLFPRQPENVGRSVSVEVWRFDHRRLYRLGRDGIAGPRRLS